MSVPSPSLWYRSETDIRDLSIASLSPRTAWAGRSGSLLPVTLVCFKTSSAGANPPTCALGKVGWGTHTHLQVCPRFHFLLACRRQTLARLLPGCSRSGCRWCGESAGLGRCRVRGTPGTLLSSLGQAGFEQGSAGGGGCHEERLCAQGRSEGAGEGTQGMISTPEACDSHGAFPCVPPPLRPLFLTS